MASTELSPESQDSIVAETSARLDGLRRALWAVVLMTLAALFCTGLLPRRSLTRSGSIWRASRSGHAGRVERISHADAKSVR